MKRQWTPDELVEHWTLSSGDGELIANKTRPTRLGFALLLKYFQHDGRFPQHKGELPTAAVFFCRAAAGSPTGIIRPVCLDWPHPIAWRPSVTVRSEPSRAALRRVTHCSSWRTPPPLAGRSDHWRSGAGA